MTAITTSAAYNTAYTTATATMTYNELRAALKVLRAAGHDVPSLRSKKPVLAAAYAAIIASQAVDTPSFFTQDEVFTCVRRYFVDSTPHTVVRPAGGALAIRHDFDFGAPSCPVVLVPVLAIAAFYGGVDLPAPYNPSCPLPQPMTYQLCLPAAAPTHFTQDEEFTCLPSGGRFARRRHSAAGPMLVLASIAGVIALGAAVLVGAAYKLISDVVDYCML